MFGEILSAVPSFGSWFNSHAIFLILTKRHSRAPGSIITECKAKEMYQLGMCSVEKKKIGGERVGRRGRAREEMKNESHSSSLQSWEFVVCLKRFELGQTIRLAQPCNTPF